MFLEMSLKRDRKVGKVERSAERLEKLPDLSTTVPVPASRQPSPPPQPHNPNKRAREPISGGKTQGLLAGWGAEGEARIQKQGK